ncbi:hypothetical protein D1872_197340 [compost metagenome]
MSLSSEVALYLNRINEFKKNARSRIRLYDDIFNEAISLLQEDDIKATISREEISDILSVWKLDIEGITREITNRELDTLTKDTEIRHVIGEIVVDTVKSHYDKLYS